MQCIQIIQPMGGTKSSSGLMLLSQKPRVNDSDHPDKPPLHQQGGFVMLFGAVRLDRYADHRRHLTAPNRRPSP